MMNLDNNDLSVVESFYKKYDANLDAQVCFALSRIARVNFKLNQPIIERISPYFVDFVTHHTDMWAAYEILLEMRKLKIDGLISKEIQSDLEKKFSSQLDQLKDRFRK